MLEGIITIIITLSLFIFSIGGNQIPDSVSISPDLEALSASTLSIQQEISEQLYLKKLFYKDMNHYRSLVIHFAGDCTLGHDDSFSYLHSFPYILQQQQNNYGYFFEKVKPLFDKDDFTLINLEGTFTNSVTKADKKFRFKGKPEYVQVLKEGSIEMVNIANNHIYDYGKEGFLDTLKVLEKAGIYYSGEGYVSYYETKGITIASLGYGGWGTHIKSVMERDIEKARESADLVIVSFHWGEERAHYPNTTQTQLGRFAIDVGADIVIGHHPHVLQGIELYKDKYIVYSLGNFSFGGNKNPTDKDTMIFRGTFIFRNNTLTQSEGTVIPCQISSSKSMNNYQPIILEGQEKERVINRVYEYSSRLAFGIRKEQE